MRTEDGHIIDKCLNGDPAAFGLLVDKYKGAVYALAYSKLGNFHDAEDVTQEVFIKAYEKLRTLRRWDNFLAWVYAITSNLCKMMMRARARRPDHEFIGSKDPGISIASRRESLARESLYDALDSLPEIYRQVLTLYYLGGMSNKEIARFLGASPAAIRQRLTRARSQLREEMLAVINTTSNERRLQVDFTFRIVEAVKRTKIQPIARTAGLPWGLSLATGVILAVLTIGSHLSLPDFMDASMDSTPSSETALAYIGEVPVDILRTSRVPAMSGKQGSDYDGGIMLPDQQNTALMAPRGEGGKIPEEPSAQLGKGFLHGIAYSPDGKIFAAATSLGIKLYDAGNLNETGVLVDEPYYEIAFSPDGQILAGRADDGIYLWDFQARKQIGSVQAGSVIAFSPDGGILAATGIYGDNVIRLWDVQRLERIGVLQGHTEYIRTIAFTPDGKTLASAGYDKTIRLWSVQENKQIGILEGHKEVVFTMAISPDGEILASGSEGNNEGILLLWDIQEQELIGSLEGHKSLLTSIAFSPDGKTLVSESDDQTIRIWNVQEQKQIGMLPGDIRSFTSQIIFNPDGKTIASTSDAQRIRFWDIHEQKQVGIIEGFMPHVLSVAFSPDGSILASDNNAMIMFWDVKDQKQIGDSILPEDNFFCGSVAFSPDGKLLAAGAYGGLVYLIDVQEQRRIGLLKGPADSIRSLTFSPDGKILMYAGNSDNTVRLWDVAEQKEIGVLRNGSWTHCLSVSPDGKTIAVAVGGERLVRLWDIQTQEEIGVLKDDTCAANSVDISPDGKLLAASNQCGVIRLWDYEKQEQIGELRGHTDGARVAFSPDGRWLVSIGGMLGNAVGTINAAALIWDVQQQKQIAILQGHTGRINCIAFSPGGKWLASGGDDGTILLWEVNLQVPGVSVEPSGKQLGKWGDVKKTELYQNFPNPFNPETWIPFSLSEPQNVVIRIYNSTGQLTRTLDLGRKSSGAYLSREKAAYWDGRNEHGELVASDVYFYAMDAGSSTCLRKMAMVR